MLSCLSPGIRPKVPPLFISLSLADWDAKANENEQIVSNIHHCVESHAKAPFLNFDHGNSWTQTPMPWAVWICFCLVSGRKNVSETVVTLSNMCLFYRNHKPVKCMYLPDVAYSNSEQTTKYTPSNAIGLNGIT